LIYVVPTWNSETDTRTAIFNHRKLLIRATPTNTVTAAVIIACSVRRPRSSRVRFRVSGRAREREKRSGRPRVARVLRTTLRRVSGRQKPSAAGVLRSQHRLPFFSRFARTIGWTRRTHRDTGPVRVVVCPPPSKLNNNNNNNYDNAIILT